MSSPIIIKEYLHQIGQNFKLTCHKDAVIKVRKEGFWITIQNLKNQQGEI